MPLLSRNNTEFSVSVTRRWSPHFKSRALKNAVAALVAFQNDNTAAKLRALYTSLHDWIRVNPKEFARRGSRVADLRTEILQKAAQLHANVADIDDAFRRVAHVWKTIFLQDVRGKVAIHANLWQNIEITDRPTGVPGQYNFTAGNHYSEQDRNQANLDTNEAHVNKQNHPKYWLRLGRRVITPQADGTSYGRCFSCAAAVIYEMVMDPGFDEYMIEHVGAEDYDHHLVLIDRANATGNDSAGLNHRRPDWMSTTAVVDVWQGNLNNNTNYVTIAADNMYALSPLKWFCAFPPNRRVQDRVFATALQAPQRNVVNQNHIQQARAALQDGPGPATRNRKVGGRWIIEREVADGV